MRLLDTQTGQFVETQNPEDLVFAILSHTWSDDGEQSYQEVREIQRQLGVPILRGSVTSEFYATSISDYPLDSLQFHPPLTTPPSLRTSPSLAPAPQLNDEQPTQALPTRTLDHPNLSPKIRSACAVARKYGYRLLWIDSCCIDKENSSELFETINSMFRWYSIASACFAYLGDLMPSCGRRLERCFPITPCLEHHGPEALKFCKWFTRGWTLQELVAPKDVLFLDETWCTVGTKTSFANIVAEKTGIEAEVLTHRKRLDEVSVANRMSWAAHRGTTREEDRAYSLLGIFDIHMPIIYGEGDNAFIRLQEKIMQTIPDQTLFVHGLLETLQPDQTSISSWSMWKCSMLGLLSRSPGHLLTIVAKQLRPISQEELASRLGTWQRQDLRVHSYSFTPDGVHMSLPIIPIPHILPHGVTPILTHHTPPPECQPCPMPSTSNIPCLAILACEASSNPGSLLALPCLMEEGQVGEPGTHWQTAPIRWHSGPRTVTYILSPQLVARLHSAPGPWVTPISIRLFDAKDDCDSESAAWTSSKYMALQGARGRPEFSTRPPVPVLQNRQALKDAGYTVSDAYGQLSDRYPHSPWCNIFLVRLSKGSFNIEARFAVRGRSSTWSVVSSDRVFYAIRVDVGTHLDAADLWPSSDLQRVFHCFTPIQIEVDNSGQGHGDMSASREVRVPLDGTQGSETTVTLRIALSWHPKLWRWLLTVEVFGLTDKLLRRLEDI